MELSLEMASAEPAVDEVSSDGITIEGIRAFIATIRGGFGAQTTAAVVQDAVIPLTATPEPGVSYTERLRSSGSHFVGPATVFVSHAWGYELRALVDALEAWENKKRASGAPPTFFWLDVFTVSQHKTGSRPFEWWRDVFCSHVGRIKHTLLVLQWANPIPLSRIWCVFEIASTVRTGARLDIIMPPREEALFVDALLHRYTDVYKALCSVRVRTAQAHHESDRIGILAAIDASDGGATALDAAVVEAMQLWMLGVAHSSLPADKAERGSPKHLKLLYEVSRLCWRLGRYADAEALAREAHVARADGSYASSLADILFSRGKIDEAAALWEEVLVHRACLHSTNALARARVVQRRFLDARALLETAHAAAAAAGDAVGVREAATCRAELSLAEGDAAGAARALIGLHAQAAATHGPSAPFVLALRSRAAHARSAAGDVAEAGAEFAAVLADQRRVRGSAHKDTLDTLARFAAHARAVGDEGVAATLGAELERHADALREIAGDRDDRSGK